MPDGQMRRVGTLVPESFERREPGMGIVAAGVEVVEVHECTICGALVAEWGTGYHLNWHKGTD